MRICLVFAYKHKHIKQKSELSAMRSREKTEAKSVFNNNNYNSSHLANYAQNINNNIRIRHK